MPEKMDMVAIVESVMAERQGESRLEARFVRADIDIDIETRQVLDMTPDAAQAMVAVAHETHAVPAMEQTKRAAELTKRDKQFTIRHSLVCAVVVVCAAMIVFNPAAGLSIVGLVTVLGGVYGWALHVNRAKEKGGDGSSDNDP